MNPDDDYNNHDDKNRDADKFHIAPEYGEQGEGPGEQPVKRVEHMPTTDGFKKPVSISITEVKAEVETKEKIVEKEPSTKPSDTKSPFNHGEDDIMQYFTTEKKETEKMDLSTDEKRNEAVDASTSGSIFLRENTIGSDPVTTGVATGARSGASKTHSEPIGARDDITEASNALSTRSGISEHHSGPSGLSGQATGISEDAGSHKQKKKTNLVSTIAIVFITILITAVIVFVILFLTQGRSKDNNITINTDNTPQAEVSSITCTKTDATDEEKTAAGDATAINTTVIANYTDDELDDYSVTKRYTYSDSAAAAAGLSKIKAAYTDKYVDILTINQDPFSSTFAQKEKEVTESHFASADDITSENMSLINIPKGTDEDDTAPYISVVESTLKLSGYTCKVKSAD